MRVEGSEGIVAFGLCLQCIGVEAPEASDIVGDDADAVDRICYLYLTSAGTASRPRSNRRTRLSSSTQCSGNSKHSSHRMMKLSIKPSTQSGCSSGAGPRSMKDSGKVIPVLRLLLR